MNRTKVTCTRAFVGLAAIVLLAAACTTGAGGPTLSGGGSAAVSSAVATSPAASGSAGGSAPATSASASVTAAASSIGGTGVYTPLTEAPCDVSGKSIHFLSILKGHPTLRLWQQGFLDQAKALGFESATIAAPDDADWEKTVGLGEGILATGTDGVVFGFVDPKEQDLIKKFGDQNIPVVVGHVVVPEGTYPGLTAWSGFVPEKWGKAAADVIGEKIGGQGAVAITEGSFNVVEDAVAKAFSDELKAKYPNVKVLPPQEEGFDPPQAIAKAVAILQANPDVVGALSTTGAGPVTWAGAADETGRTVASIGPDMTRPNLDAVRDGKVYALAAQPGYEEHQQAVDLIARAICGETVPYGNELETKIVTAEGLEPYYDVVNKIE